MDFIIMRLGLLCVAVFLFLGNGAFGAMDKNNLKKIIDYITQYGIEDKYHYAVAARLDHQYCRDPNPRNLGIALPGDQMLQMKNAISQANGIYVPDQIGDIVAARPNKKDKPVQHAEWRLLTGGQNSPVEKILANKDQNSCLIFFSRLSPCVDWCLNLNNMRNIVDLVNPLFNKYNEDSRAFVFETVYRVDEKKEPKAVVDAWSLIRKAPLFRCNRNSCIQCFDNNQLGDNNPCLNLKRAIGDL